MELDKTFKSFFRHDTAYPCFRSKENRLFIPKFQDGIAFRDKSMIPEHIRQIVITKDVGRYYASIQYETDAVPQKGNGIAGIDMGIKSFLTASDGLQIEPLNALRKKEERLKRQQKRLSRKKKGSKNRGKQIVRVQKIHQKIRDMRSDYNHRVSRR